MSNYTYIILIITIAGCTNPQSKNEGNNASSKLDTTEIQEGNEINDSTLFSLLDQNNVEEKDSDDIEAETLQNKISADTLGACEKCNISYVLDVEENIDNLEYNQVYKFLCTIRYSCINNAEFGEYSNEILFLLFEKQVQLTFKVLESNSGLNLNLIFEELSSPIHDGIEVKLINNIIKSKISDGEIKKEVLESLQVAIDRYNR